MSNYYSTEIMALRVNNWLMRVEEYENINNKIYDLKQCFINNSNHWFKELQDLLIKIIEYSIDEFEDLNLILENYFYKFINQDKFIEILDFIYECFRKKDNIADVYEIDRYSKFEYEIYNHVLNLIKEKKVNYKVYYTTIDNAYTFCYIRNKCKYFNVFHIIPHILKDEEEENIPFIEKQEKEKQKVDELLDKVLREIKESKVDDDLKTFKRYLKYLKNYRQIEMTKIYEEKNRLLCKKKIKVCEYALFKRFRITQKIEKDEKIFCKSPFYINFAVRNINKSLAKCKSNLFKERELIKTDEIKNFILLSQMEKDNKKIIYTKNDDKKFDKQKNIDLMREKEEILKIVKNIDNSKIINCNKKTTEELKEIGQIKLDKKFEQEEKDKKSEWDELNHEIKINRRILESMKKNEDIKYYIYKDAKKEFHKNEDKINKTNFDMWKSNTFKRNILNSNINFMTENDPFKVLIFNIPELTENSIKKFITVLIKKIKIECKDINIMENDIKINMNTRCVIIQHINAEKISIVLDNHILDKSHTFATILCSNINNIMKTPNSYQKIDIQDFLIPMEDNSSFIDKNANDTYMTITIGNKNNFDLNIFKHKHSRYSSKSNIQLEKTFSNISFANYSPTGKYFYVTYKNYVDLFISYTKIITININGVVLVEFSENENYLVLKTENKSVIFSIIYNCIISETCENIHFLSNNKLFISNNENQIKMTNIISKNVKKITVGQISSLTVSKKYNYLAYIIKNQDSINLHIVRIIDNNFEEISNNPYFSVTDIRMEFHSYKPFLLCSIRRKTGNNVFINKIIKLKDEKVDNIIIKSIDCECIQYKFNAVNEFIIYQTNQNNFVMENDIEIYKTKKYKHVSWSNNGKYLILANLLKEDNIELVNLDTKKTKMVEFRFCTNMIWSYCSRYFILFSSKGLVNRGNGYKIYNFLGDLLYEKDIKDLYTVNWRNIPTIPLSSLPEDKKPSKSYKEKVLKEILEDEIEESEINVENSIFNRIKDFKDYENFLNSFDLY